jgi:hypothetical protein
MSARQVHLPTDHSGNSRVVGDIITLLIFHMWLLSVMLIPMTCSVVLALTLFYFPSVYVLFKDEESNKKSVSDVKVRLKASPGTLYI